MSTKHTKASGTSIGNTIPTKRATLKAPNKKRKKSRDELYSASDGDSDKVGPSKKKKKTKKEAEAEAEVKPKPKEVKYVPASGCELVADRVQLGE
jgi:hypothetical protein